MKKSLPLLFLLMVCMILSHAQNSYSYYFNNNLQGTNGAPDLKAVCPGSVSYSLTDFSSVGGGVRPTLNISPRCGVLYADSMGLLRSGSSYTIVMYLMMQNVVGYRKLIDYKNLGPDGGLYSLGGELGFYGSPALFSNNIFTDSTYFSVVISRDSTTAQVDMYANAQHVGSFAVITNINEHVELEQKLLKTEVQLRSLSRQVLSAQELERRRIALELHDGIGQTLSAIKFFVENNLSAMTQESGIQNTKIEMVVPKLQGAIEEVRRISMDLRPSLLDDIGIIATLSWFCRESQQTYQNLAFSLDVENTQETDIPKELKTEMFRIVQEAVNNACKYSAAKNIQISLKIDGKHIHLWIKDDGKGFDYQKIADLQGYSESKGLGLTGMRERTENAGGWFSVNSAPDVGTSIACMWSAHSLPASIEDRRSVNDRRSRNR